MNSKILWKAKKFQKNKSNLFKYEKFLFSKYNFKITQNYKIYLDGVLKTQKNFGVLFGILQKSRALK